MVEKQHLIVHDRLYQFCKWLYPLVANYPKTQRYVLGARTQELATELMLGAIQANAERSKTTTLADLVVKLRQLKTLIRLAMELKYIFAIFANSKHQLQEWQDSVAQFANGLGLSLNPTRTMLSPASAGINWLGFRVLQPGIRRLARRNIIRAARMVHKLARLYHAGHVDSAEISTHLRSWAAHASYAQTWHLRTSLFNSVNWSAK